MKPEKTKRRTVAEDGDAARDNDGQNVSSALRQVFRYFERLFRYAGGVGRRGFELSEQVTVESFWRRMTLWIRRLARPVDDPVGSDVATAPVKNRRGERRLSTEDDRPEPRRQRERQVVGVMVREFEKTIGFSSIVVFVALLLVGGYAVWKQDRTMIVAAVIVAVLFILAVVRQAVLAWRTKRGYFGSSEHEVRELLAFAMRHPTPQDFFDDNGHLLPAFDVALREARASALGQPQVANL
jgi:hypothetical protein